MSRILLLLVVLKQMDKIKIFLTDSQPEVCSKKRFLQKSTVFTFEILAAINHRRAIRIKFQRDHS